MAHTVRLVQQGGKAHTAIFEWLIFCRYHIFISFLYLYILEPYNQYPIALFPLILEGLTTLKREGFHGNITTAAVILTARMFIR